MAAQWWWWILGVVLVGAELLSGTFYLLALGIAFLLGGIAAWLGAPVEAQLLVAGILAFVGTALAHRWRLRVGTPAPQLPLDVGNTVQVQSWHADGRARVAYRGTHYDAVLASPQAVREKTMYIVAVEGSTLVIDAAPPPAALA
jgi:membrane protein implicated in regulation of membrane protease activity